MGHTTQKKSLQEKTQQRKMVIKFEFTPLPDCNILPFSKGLKNTAYNCEPFLPVPLPHYC